MRLIGALLIVASLGMGGMIGGMRYNRRIKELEDWRQALKWCEMEINYRLLPLKEVLETVAERLGGTVGEVFRQCARGIEEHSSAQESWDKAIDNYLHFTALTRKDGEFLRRFGAVLGKSDLKQQNKNFDFLEENLRQALQEALAEKKAKAKMCRYVGFFSGLALVLILL